MGPSSRCAAASRASRATRECTVLRERDARRAVISRAETVSIFFVDLFGYDEPVNAPDVANDPSSTLRLPSAFEQLHAARLSRETALDIPLASSSRSRRKMAPSGSRLHSRVFARRSHYRPR
jgi:hypothetical protein